MNVCLVCFKQVQVKYMRYSTNGANRGEAEVKVDWWWGGGAMTNKTATTKKCCICAKSMICNAVEHWCNIPAILQQSQRKYSGLGHLVLMYSGCYLGIVHFFFPMSWMCRVVLDFNPLEVQDDTHYSTFFWQDFVKVVTVQSLTHMAYVTIWDRTHPLVVELPHNLVCPQGSQLLAY